MLSLGAPADLFSGVDDPESLAAVSAKASLSRLTQIGFFIGFAFQATLYQNFYLKWMLVPTQKLSAATAPFLLTTVSWFLLAILGVKAEIVDLIGINFPAMSFGIGCFF